MTQSNVVDTPQVLVDLMTRDDNGGPDADPGYPLPCHSLDEGRIPKQNRIYKNFLMQIMDALTGKCGHLHLSCLSGPQAR